MDLDIAERKSSIVSDTVAFLNAGGGRIVIGVEERKKSDPVLRPMTGGMDAFCRKLQDVLVDNIVERPAKLQVDAIDVDGGHLVCIWVGKNVLTPYGNKLNGAYLRRRGRKNEILLPAEMAELMNVRKQLVERVGPLADAQIEALRADGFLTLDCPEFHLAVLPAQHLNYDFPQFTNQTGIMGRKAFAVHPGYIMPFKRVDSGYQVSSIDMEQHNILRFFVSDDWLVHSVLCHPISYDAGPGRIDMKTTEQELGHHLRSVGQFIEDEGIEGPFAVCLEIVNLHSRPHFQVLMRGVRSIKFGPPTFNETFDPEAILSSVIGRIRQVAFG